MSHIQIYANIVYSLIGVLFMVGFIHMIFSGFFEIWKEKRILYKTQK